MSTTPPDEDESDSSGSPLAEPTPGSSGLDEPSSLASEASDNTFLSGAYIVDWIKNHTFVALLLLILLLTAIAALLGYWSRLISRA